MATYLDDGVLDAALQDIIDEADTVTYCAGAPSDYAAATTLKSVGGNRLSNQGSVAPADFAIADGNTSGRRLSFKFRQFTAKEQGTVDHVALVDDDTSTLIAVLETQADVTIPADKVGYSFNQDSVDVLEIRDPS